MTTTIALHQNDWLAKLSTINLSIGGRGVTSIGLARSTTRSATPWWTTSTLAASSALVVYQPLKAASYAASLVDLTGNGNDVSFIYLGVTLPEERRPEWSLAEGWKFLTDPVNTVYSRMCFFPDGLYAQSDWSVFCVYQAVDLISGQCRLTGSRRSSTGDRFYLWPAYATSTFYFGHGPAYSGGASVLSGDVIMSGINFGAINGVQKAGNFTIFDTPIAVQMGIGTTNYGGIGFPYTTGGWFRNGFMKAIALWNRALSLQEYLDVRSQYYAAVA